VRIGPEQTRCKYFPPPQAKVVGNFRNLVVMEFYAHMVKKNAPAPVSAAQLTAFFNHAPSPSFAHVGRCLGPLPDDASRRRGVRDRLAD
jgi:hypothetical protein